MSGFETNRSRIESELIQSMMKKTGYLNEIIKQLQEKIQVLEAKITTLEAENLKLKQIPETPPDTLSKPSKFSSKRTNLTLKSLRSNEELTAFPPMSATFISNTNKTAKKVLLSKAEHNALLMLSPHPSKRKFSSDEYLNPRSYNIQKPFEKSKKYYEDIGNSIVAPLYLLQTTRPKLSININGNESESEEIIFKGDELQLKPLILTNPNKEPTKPSNKKKTYLNFIKSPIHRTPNKRRSLLVNNNNTIDDFANRIKMINLESQKEKKDCEHLFEDFFVIGVDKSELKPGLELFGCPKIIHSMGFTGEGTENDCSWKRVIQDFAFPFGIKAKYMRKTNKIQKILFSCDLNEKNERTFVFLLQNDKSCQKSSFTPEKTVLGLSNPNKILYGICFVTKDFCTIPEDSIHHYWAFPKALCFVTFFPFIKLFIDVIFSLLNVIKTRRLKEYLKNMKPGENQLMSLDIDYFLKELSFEASQILSNIYNYGPLKFDSTLNFTYQTQNIAYNLPPIEKMFILETLWGSFLSFSNICFDDFVFLLFAILLETPICFLSVNLCLLTSTILTFYGLLKPFKWPHPIIFPLPESLFTLFDSPVPIIFGLNQNLNFIKENSFDIQHQNIIFCSLDDNILIIDHGLWQELGLSIPYFNNFRSYLRSLYSRINNKLSRNFPEAKKSPKKGYLPNKRKNYKSEDKILVYTATETDESVCKRIIEGVYDVLNNHIAKKVPKDTDYEEIEKKMLKDIKNQEDLRFWKRFLKTQMFCYFLEG